MKIDVHVHTTASACSIFSPHELVIKVLEKEVGAVATTNHHDPYGDTNYLKKELDNHGIMYFPGMELTCQWGDFLIFGEDLSKFTETGGHFPVDILPRADIAVIWAHPFRFMCDDEVSAIRWKVVPYIDAVEGINGNCMIKNGQANWKAFNLASEINKPITAGSDAHSADMFFWAWTEFLEPVNSYADFIRIIKEGKVRPEQKIF